MAGQPEPNPQKQKQKKNIFEKTPIPHPKKKNRSVGDVIVHTAFKAAGFEIVKLKHMFFSLSSSLNREIDIPSMASNKCILKLFIAE